MKFNDFKGEGVTVEKAELVSVLGGTSTTSYIVVGYSEVEYEDTNGDGDLSKEEIENGGIIVEFPNG